MPLPSAPAQNRTPPSLLRRRRHATVSSYVQCIASTFRRYPPIAATATTIALAVVVILCLAPYPRPPRNSPSRREDGSVGVASVVVVVAPDQSFSVESHSDAHRHRLGAPPPPPQQPIDDPPPSPDDGHLKVELAAVPESAEKWAGGAAGRGGKGSDAKAHFPTRGKTEVSCGGHFAPSCRACVSGGQGPVYCNGQCKWDTAANECIEPPSLIHPAYLDLVKNFYAYQPVKTDGGGFVNVLLVRAPFRSREERDMYDRYKDDILFLGISSFESFPLSSPNPFSANFSDTLYTSMFPGFLHMMHNPEQHFPPHVKTLLLSQSDFELPLHEVPLGRDHPERHTYDFTFSGTDQNIHNGCVGWASFAKNWSFVLEALDVMCSDEFNLRGVLVATRDKQNVVACPIPKACEGKMTQTTFLTQDKFFHYTKRSKFAFVPQVYDASPRVAAQALALDVPLLMNRHILGGWKYINDETGEFFSDLSDLKDSLRRILSKSASGAYRPRNWMTEHYGNEKAGKVFLDWVKEHFADRVTIPEGTKYLIPTGA